MFGSVFVLADSGAGEVSVGGMDVVDEPCLEEDGEVSVDADDVDASSGVDDSLVDGVGGEGFGGVGEDVDDVEARPGEPEALFLEGGLGEIGERFLVGRAHQRFVLREVTRGNMESNGLRALRGR